MLENMRRQGASIFIYLIFGILIAIFVVNIGGSGQGGSGCSPASNTVLTVNGSRVHRNDYFIAYGSFSMVYGNVPTKKAQREQEALEVLLRRELLAQAAGERGLRVTEDMVEDEVRKGYFFYGGLRRPLGAHVLSYQRSKACDSASPPPECEKPCMFFQGRDVGMCGSGYYCDPDPKQTGDEIKGTCDQRCVPGGTQCGEGEMCTDEGRCALWDGEQFGYLLRSLNVSKKTYMSEQARSMQANLMLDILAKSIKVSPQEAREDFIFNKTTVTYDLVKFAPAAYRAAMKLTDEDAKRFLATHEDEVKAKFKADERTYKDVKPQLKLRKLFIAKAEPPAAKPDDKKADDKKADDKKADDKKADDKKADDKKADKKADKQSGMPIEEAKAKLAAARAAIAANKKKFADAVAELATEESDRLNGGDLGWRKVESPGLDDKALNDAVKALKRGEMTDPITTDRGVYLILVEDTRPVGDAKDLTYDQVKLEIAADLARDVWSKERAKRDALASHAELLISKKKLSDVFKGEELPGLKSGSLAPRGDIIIDTPVAWKAEAPDGSGGGGSAGSGAPPTPTPTPTPTPAPTPGPAPSPNTAKLEPSKDILPQFGTITQPRAVTMGLGRPITRQAELPGLPKELTAVLFDQLEVGALAPRVFEERDGSYVIVQLTGKGEPKLDEFDKDAFQLTAALEAQRASSYINEWLHGRCEDLLQDGKVEPDKAFLTETDDKGNVKSTGYRPCQRYAPQKPGAQPMPDLDDLGE